MDTKDKKKLFIIVTLLLSLISIGTIGYMTLIGASFVDALYMTIITISTVGYGEVGRMTADSKIFSIFIIFGGISIVGYAFTYIVTIFVEGILNQAWKVKRMNSKIENLKDHYIICGSGETGQSVIKSFKESNHPFVIIEKNEDRYQELLEEGLLIIQGDATHEDILEKAKINLAKGLISALSTDADNLFTVLTARQMNEGLYIVSRAIEGKSNQKLKKAGANNTVSPNEIGGNRMAALVTKPSVISFLDMMTRAGEVVLDLESVRISKSSKMIGKTLREIKIPEQTGLIVLAIKKSSGEEFAFNPNSEETLDLNDILIVLGEDKQVEKLRGMAWDDGSNPV